MRLGYFGGSFDPVHLGHLQMAEELGTAAKLDRVFFLPARRSPHKQTEPGATAFERLTMLGLALRTHDRFAIDPREMDRPAPSYTVDTLREIQRERSGDELFFLMGLDSLEALPRWREFAALSKIVEFLVATRPGVDLAKFGEKLPPELRFRRIETTPHPAASTEIRRRIRAGESTEGLLSAASRAYIDERKIYRL